VYPRFDRAHAPRIRIFFLVVTVIFVVDLSFEFSTEYPGEWIYTWNTGTAA
jgi:hypothetical protein